ncbi:MAG: glycosyltransferase family 2 protein [Candidatus Eremiobacteraeota bacterium]|nr:glycosyltransferase family 2 protein [Candidatus Eremiobacteraeota bacterium]
MEQATYLVPLKAHDLAALDELTEYFFSLPQLEVLVIDASPPEIYAEHSRRWLGRLTHLPVDPAIRGLNGKTRGVLSGLRYAAHEKIIIADDDVRYTADSLSRVIAALDRADVVRPQNFFYPQAWHTILDGGRILLNRLTGGDWPGTLGVRRSALANGYDPDVLFENLELVRTVVARGGRHLLLDDVYVPRRPPQSSHFWSQRVRQAYDEFARPGRMIAQLLIAPALVWCSLKSRWSSAALCACAVVVLAEAGRRRRGGRKYFPALASLAAPLWLLERALCSWLALASRLRYGGVRYSDNVIRSAATPPIKLKRIAA